MCTTVNVFILLLVSVSLILLYVSIFWQKEMPRSRYRERKEENIRPSKRNFRGIFKSFWVFFHRSLAPNVELGGLWPPLGISAFNPFQVPQ